MTQAGLRPGKVLLSPEDSFPFRGKDSLGLEMNGLWEIKRQRMCWFCFLFFLYDGKTAFGNVGNQFSMSS